jgi:dihydroxyacetone kinase-like predicted kinase
VVAVSNGEGMANVFSSLGVSAIVPGGQTMNPSTMDILQAVEAVPSDNVIILPNNRNIVLTAAQVQSLTKKQVRVIPTETIPQGMTAMVAFIPEADFRDNIHQMEQVIPLVRTIEITCAIRNTRVDGLEIKEGQAIGLLDGRLVAAGNREEDVVLNILSHIDAKKFSIATVYYGSNTTAAEASALAENMCRIHPSLEMEIVDGGQPHYSYIISVE